MKLDFANGNLRVGRPVNQREIEKFKAFAAERWQHGINEDIETAWLSFERRDVKNG